MIEDHDVEGLQVLMATHDLMIENGRLIPRTPEVSTGFIEKKKFFNSRQQAKKILLNSLN